MNQCSRHTRAGTTSHQRSTLPASREGHALSSELHVQDQECSPAGGALSAALAGDGVTPATAASALLGILTSALLGILTAPLSGGGVFLARGRSSPVRWAP
jgi:hypothetical protein